MSIMEDLNQKPLEDEWRKVRLRLNRATSIAWDGCHKTYVLLDEEQHQQMIEYGYSHLLRVEDLGVDEAFDLLREWWNKSCELVFISSVRSVAFDEDPNQGFSDLIGQFAWQDEGVEEEDWDV